MAVAESKVLAQHRQPAAAPHPVSEEGIDDRSYKQTVNDECGILPAFGHRACRNRCGGVHEHHLEEEQCKNGYVIGRAREEEACAAEETEALPKEIDCHLVIQSGVAAHGSYSAEAPEHYAETEHVESDHAQRIDE